MKRCPAEARIGHRALWLGNLVLVTLGVACRPAAQSPESGSHVPVSSARSGSDPPPPGVPASPEEEADWRRARSGEPLALEALARREGAAVLVAVVDRSDEWARVALDAFPFAEEAPEYVGALCRRLAAADEPWVLPMVRAVHAVVSEPPDATEQVDPVGVLSCREPLRSAAENRASNARARDFAASALQMLDERAARPAVRRARSGPN